MRTALGILLAFAASSAFAVTITATPSTIPEPGALSLLGVGAVAGLLVLAKKRKNKK